MKRWLVVLPVCILLAAAFASLTTAQVTSLMVTITSYEEDKVTPGSTFQVYATISKPAGITIPTGSQIYTSMFYFPDSEPVYPADYPEYKYYVEGTTSYTMKVKMKADAPVGQEGVYLGVYWTIPITGFTSTPAQGDNVTFSISDNQYTATIVKVDPKTQYTYYYLVDESGWDIYLRSDQRTKLFVRALASNVEIKAAPGFQLPLIPIVGALVALLVVVGIVVVVLKRRAPAEVPPPPPPPPIM